MTYNNTVINKKNTTTKFLILKAYYLSTISTRIIIFIILYLF